MREWSLPLNPEELGELAYAVLRHHDSDLTFEAIEEAVGEQLADFRRRYGLES